jgi:hypothetical protein
MKKLAMVAALAFTSSAFASIHLTVRSDYVGTQKYTDSTNTDVGSTSLFTPSFARLYLNGKVGDADVKSALDIRSFTQTQDGTGQITPAMTVDKFVHFLYFDKAVFTEGLRFQAGKLDVNQGGWEHDQIEAGDSYMDSIASSGTVVGRNAASAATIVAGPGNGSGAGLSYTFNENHNVALQVANQVNQFSNSTTSAADTKRNTIGAEYTGWFMDKALGVKAGWMNGAADTTDATGTHKNIQYINAGVKYTASNWMATLDYLDNSSKATDNSGAETKGDTNSWVLSANYNINNMYRPLIKYEHSQNKANNNSDDLNSFKRDAFTVGVEFLTSDSLRWQIAYMNAADKNGSAAAHDKSNFSQYLAGLKWDTDFLK